MGEFDEIKRILERLELLEARVFKKKSKEKTDGSYIWESYAAAYLHRWGVLPVRNAKMNKLCSLLSERVGKDVAVKLVQFYLDQRDAFFVGRSHPLDVLLSQCEGLVTRMKTGLRITPKQAQTIDDGDSNAQAALSYLRKT